MKWALIEVTEQAMSRAAGVLAFFVFRHYAVDMASQAAKERMKRIGAFMDQANRDAVAEAAKQSPGEKIELGLQLGNFALAVAQHGRDRTPDFPLVRLWRALKERKAGR